MTEDQPQLQFSFPPPWVQLSDVERWLLLRLGVKDDNLSKVLGDLIFELQEDEPRTEHRIPAFSYDWGPPGAFTLKVPRFANVRVTVRDWSAANFSPVTPTVFARYDADGSGKLTRFPIEVRWNSVEKWFKSKEQERTSERHGLK